MVERKKKDGEGKAGSAEKIAQKTAEREGNEGGGGGGVAGTGSSKAGPSQGIADADKELRRAAIALAAGKRAEEEGSEGRSSGCWS